MWLGPKRTLARGPPGCLSEAFQAGPPSFQPFLASLPSRSVGRARAGGPAPVVPLLLTTTPHTHTQHHLSGCPPVSQSSQVWGQRGPDGDSSQSESGEEWHPTGQACCGDTTLRKSTRATSTRWLEQGWRVELPKGTRSDFSRGDQSPWAPLAGGWGLALCQSEAAPQSCGPMTLTLAGARR